MKTIAKRSMSGKTLGLILSVAMSMALLFTLLAAGDAGRVQAQTTGDCSNGVAVPNPRANSGLVSDCEALLAGRDTLAGTASLNWSSNLDIGAWDGIILEGSPGRVVELELWNYELSGELPSELGNLSSLKGCI